MVKCFIFCLLASFAILSAVRYEVADPIRDDMRNFEQQVSDIRLRLRQPNQLNDEDLKHFSRQIKQIIHDANVLKHENDEALNEQHEMLTDLGPAPTADDPTEDAEIARQRDEIESNIHFYSNRNKRLKAIMARSHNTLQDISDAEINLRIRMLKRREDFIFNRLTIKNVDTSSVELPMLPSAKSMQTLRVKAFSVTGILYMVLVLAVAIFLLSVVSKKLAKHYQRICSNDIIDNASKLEAFLCYTTRYGLIPVVIIGLVIFGTTLALKSHVDHYFAAIGVIILSGLWLFVIICKGLLCPKNSNLRLIYSTQQKANQLFRRLVMFGAILATTLGFIYFYQTHILPLNFIVITQFILITALCSTIYALMKPAFWTYFNGMSIILVYLLRTLTTVIIIAIPILFFIGYVNLSIFFLINLLKSMAVISAAYVSFLITKNVVLFYSKTPKEGHKKLQIGNQTVSLFQYWTIGLCGTVIWVGLILGFLFIWGYGSQLVLLTSQKLWQGIELKGHQISFVRFVLSIFVFFGLIYATKALMRILDKYVFPYTNLKKGLADALRTFSRYFCYIIAVLLTAKFLGFELTSIAYILGGLSVGIGFALQPIVINVVSGFIMLIERPLKIGDVLEFNGEMTTVNKIRLRSTQVRTFEKASINIPNSHLINNPIKNWTHENLMRRLDIPIDLAFATDTDRAKELLQTIAQNTQGILVEPASQVIFDQFGESALKFILRVYLKDIMDTTKIKTKLHETINREFKNAGIVVAFPQRDIHIKSTAIDQIS